MKRIYDVYLNEILVGHISEGYTRRILFEFNSSYIELKDRPVLGQSFEDNLQKNYFGKKGNDLPIFFSNIIPEEGLLKDLIKTESEKKDDLTILEKLGLDLPGAVIVKPSENTEYEPRKTEINHQESELEELTNEFTVRFSLAGIQLKFSVRREEEKLLLPATSNNGDWIIKIDSTSYPNLTENEYVIMKWAESCGFDIPDCYLITSENLSDSLKKLVSEEANIFLIKRYDRNNEIRIHQEDFAQVASLPPYLKYDHVTYESLAILIVNIIGEDGYYEFIRRLTFMIASGNTDAHLKNWSLIYPDTETPILSPLYDQVFTLAWKSIPPTLALKFMGTRSIRQIDEKSFSSLALKAGMDSKKTVAEMNNSLEVISENLNKLEIKAILPEVHLIKLNEFWESANLLKRFANRSRQV